MLKKDIKYLDYNDNERSESFYFNLNKAEVMEMELSTSGGLTNMIQKIVETQDSTELIKIFKDLILKSYGEKSADGKRFMKSEASAIGFSQTEAYSDLFMALATDANLASEFVNGIVPQQPKQAMSVPN